MARCPRARPDQTWGAGGLATAGGGWASASGPQVSSLLFPPLSLEISREGPSHGLSAALGARSLLVNCEMQVRRLGPASRLSICSCTVGGEAGPRWSVMPWTMSFPWESTWPRGRYFPPCDLSTSVACPVPLGVSLSVHLTPARLGQTQGSSGAGEQTGSSLKAEPVHLELLETPSHLTFTPHPPHAGPVSPRGWSG